MIRTIGYLTNAWHICDVHIACKDVQTITSWLQMLVSLFEQNICLLKELEAQCANIDEWKSLCGPVTRCIKEIISQLLPAGGIQWYDHSLSKANAYLLDFDYHCRACGAISSGIDTRYWFLNDPMDDARCLYPANTWRYEYREQYE